MRAIMLIEVEGWGRRLASQSAWSRQFAKRMARAKCCTAQDDKERELYGRGGRRVARWDAAPQQLCTRWVIPRSTCTKLCGRSENRRGVRAQDRKYFSCGDATCIRWWLIAGSLALEKAVGFEEIVRY